MAAFLGVLSLSACGGGDSRSATAPPLPTPYYGTPCSEYDMGADGTVDTVYMYTYDADGFLTHLTDSDGYVTDYTYDDDHFYLHGITTKDGATSYEETYTRDPDGRVLTSTQTDTETSSTAYTYDAMGRAVSMSTTDSTGVTTTTFTYAGEHLNPATGRTVRAGSATSFVYTTSADDRTLHADTDAGEDGTIDGTSDITYDAKHRVLTQTTRSQGALISSQITTYASNGFEATYTRDDTEGAPADYAYVATFDSKGHMATNEASTPSGDFAGSEYREIAKQTCATPRRVGGHSGVRHPPMRDDRPVLPLVLR